MGSLQEIRDSHRVILEVFDREAEHSIQAVDVGKRTELSLQALICALRRSARALPSWQLRQTRVRARGGLCCAWRGARGGVHVWGGACGGRCGQGLQRGWQRSRT
eukprot:2224495-Pleurochrysis_carterae.AAC.1